jgi:hypothetical protein
MNGRELIQASETLPSQAEIENRLDRLEDAGDTQALHEVALRAKALEVYERHVGATDRANFFGRIKVNAEARIGSIDIQLHAHPGKAELVFGDHVVTPMRRKQWRVLGAGLQSGQLDKALAIAEADDTAASTSRVVRELQEIGAFYVATAPLLKRYRELYQSEGLTIKDVQERSGVKASTFLARPGTDPQYDKATRHVALRVAAVLGVDPQELNSVPRRREPRKRSRIRQPRKLTGGRLDETYSLIRKALQELERAAGSNGRWGTGDAWEHLYKAEEIIGKSLRQAPRAGES